MKRLLAAILLSGFALPASAVGTLIQTGSRVDMVHDDARNLIYITSGSQVLRYNVSTRTFLSSINLGGTLGGLDISPDNRTLVVADASGSSTQSWVHIVDLESLTTQTAAVATPDLSEGGTFTAVYDANGKIYTTSTVSGSGWAPMRRFDPSSGSWVNLATVRQDTMLSPSGDAETISFVEGNSSGGAWGLIDVPTGQLAWTGRTDLMSYEIATDRFGAQFSVPTYRGTKVYDDVYSQIATIGAYATPQPIGLAYHPVERIAYFPFQDTSLVLVYDMNTLAQTGSYNFEQTFGMVGNRAFQQGRTRISRDGSLLMVTVSNGVRFYQQYAPLQAAAVTATALIGQPQAVNLAGTVGNGGPLTYTVGTAPAHGTVSMAGNVATYTPAPGYVGEDSFTYRAHYGRAVRTAVASITVVDPNRAPAAIDDIARTRTTSILIPVLANDSDPDGDVLSIASVTVPNAGSATIQGTKVLFTPPKKWPASVTFDYTISDGRGKQATARVTVTRN